jgi:hypothetical protein
MKPYANRQGQSGVVAYETGEKFIKVKFVDGRIYLYDYRVPGRADVEQMKKLAKIGKGLSTYISVNVRKRYAEKIQS